ncbi:MAG: chemotaxis protein CheB [Clostridiales bacterium]|nr:chemotaxis protein CheB [Clostridiales bacterium]
MKRGYLGLLADSNIIEAMQKLQAANKRSASKIIAIAASTGGTVAIEKVFHSLPANIAPIVVVQHITSGFSKIFADRLDGICAFRVREAKQGDILKPGLALIAPADCHMRVIKCANGFAVQIFVGEKIHGVMPAADILFNSVANVAGADAIGVILTGMGEDGAYGIARMRNAGAKTIGQDEATSVVYGMPRRARELGGLDYVLPLNKIAEMIMYLLIGKIPTVKGRDFDNNS